MSLSIGIWVQHQNEGYGSLGSNPSLPLDVLEAEFQELLHERFTPEAGLHANVRGPNRWKSTGKLRWDVTVNVSGRAQPLGEAGFGLRDVHLVIYEFVLRHWGTGEYLDTTAWESH